MNLINLIAQKFGKYKRNGSEVQVNCPFCVMFGHTPNRTFKLYINISKKLYNCFRCGTSGHLKSLFPQLPALPNYQKSADTEDTVELLPQGCKLTELDYPYNELVDDFLSKRGVILSEISDAAYFCKEYMKAGYSFGPRIIFPIQQSGTYRGFQARTIYNNMEPKYIGATGMNKKGVLYNYDIAFKQHERLVLTEGFFDCLRVGSTAVALLGKTITYNQLRIIRLSVFKKIIVFLDKDAEREAWNTAHMIAPYFPSYIAIPTKKDPGEMTTEEIELLLNNDLQRVF